jgi:hypothetical protein
MPKVKISIDLPEDALAISAGSVPDLEAAISRMRERGTWIGDDLVAAILAASRRR